MKAWRVTRKRCMRSSAGYNCYRTRLRYDDFMLWKRSLRWSHNECDGVSNHRRLDGLLNRLFGRRSVKTSKPRVNGLCEGNSPVTGEFPSQKASNAENVSIWWRLHARKHCIRSYESASGRGLDMVTSCCGNILMRNLCHGKPTVTGGFPLEPSNAELWCFLWC